MKALDNLVKINQLSEDSQFMLAYGAAHSFSLAALRWHGYRSDSRYLVFQCLQHTLGLDKGHAHRAGLYRE